MASRIAPGGRRRGMGGGALRGLLLLARLIDIVVAIVCVIILVGILLVVLKANLGNSIAKAIHDAASWLTTPFHDLFKPKGKRLQIAVNWGLALVVYFIIGRFISSLLTRAGARAAVDEG